MREFPLVSVVIPTYNRWPLVAEAIDSALAQDYPNLEVIVVDDGSTDGTDRELPTRFQGRVRYVHQVNQGPSVARNTGIAAARGDYVALLDSDDLWLPGKLLRQVRELNEHPDADLAYHTCLEADQEGRSTGRTHWGTDRGVSGDVFNAMLNHHPIMTSAVMARRMTLIELGGFRAKMRHAEDTDLWLRVCARHRCRYIKKPLVLIREHEGRSMSEVLHSPKLASYMIAMYRDLLADLPSGREPSRPLIMRRMTQAQLMMLSTEQVWGAGRFAEELARLCLDRSAYIDCYRFFETLARILHVRSASNSDHRPSHEEITAAVCSGTSSSVQRHHRRALLYCALSRREFASGAAGNGVGWAARCLVEHPGVFARYLLPTLPRGFGKLAQVLRRGMRSTPTPASPDQGGGAP